MDRAANTTELLLKHARQLFWSRGYSNVSLREIAGAASVDVALVSRYFGSKRGLFEATLECIDGLDATRIHDESMLVDAVVSLFVHAPRLENEPSPVTLILRNVSDPEVGEMIRELEMQKWQRPLEKIIGDAERAAMFFAVMVGFSLAEKAMKLSGIAAPGTPAYEAQLRHLLDAALSMRR